MKNYWFGKNRSTWEVWTLMLSAFALGQGYVWVWLLVLFFGAAIEGVWGD